MAVSVVQGWIAELPFKQQAVLIAALRGCDGASKRCPAKEIIKFIRRCVVHPAYEDYARMERAGFLSPRNPDPMEAFGLALAAFDELPLHFVTHLMHAVEIVGYKHPSIHVRIFAELWYKRFCDQMHMTPETAAQMEARLGSGDLQGNGITPPYSRDPFAVYSELPATMPFARIE